MHKCISCSLSDVSYNFSQSFNPLLYSVAGGLESFLGDGMKCQSIAGHRHSHAHLHTSGYLGTPVCMICMSRVCTQTWGRNQTCLSGWEPLAYQILHITYLWSAATWGHIKFRNLSISVKNLFNWHTVQMQCSHIQSYLHWLAYIVGDIW